MKPPFLIKPVEQGDLDDVSALADKMKGMTSLPADRIVIENKIQKSIKSFNSVTREEDGIVFLVAKTAVASRFMGTTAIYPHVGRVAPSWKYQKEQECIVMDPHSFKNCSELVTTILDKEYRASGANQTYRGAGQIMSRSRLMFVANAAAERFSDTFFTEFRGFVDDNERAPFADWFSDRFFQTSFAELDKRLGAEGYEKTLSDFFREYANVPLSRSDIPADIWATMHKPYKNSEPAMKILSREGIIHTNKMGVHDWGPQASAHRKDIVTIRDSRVLSFRHAALAEETSRWAIVSNVQSDLNFRATRALVQVEDDHVLISSEAAGLLEVTGSDQVRVGPEAFS